MSHKKPRLITLLLAIATILSTSLWISDGAAAQHRRRNPQARKVSSNKAPAPAPKPEPYDIDVEVVTGHIMFTDLTTPMLKVTHRDRRPIIIRKVTVNDEWVVTSKMHHSTHDIVSLPVEMRLGDTLEWAVYPPYKKEVVYVDLDTDVGVLQFKGLCTKLTPCTKIKWDVTRCTKFKTVMKKSNELTRRQKYSPDSSHRYILRYQKFRTHVVPDYLTFSVKLPQIF